jgi:NADPH-ferrihemoprotein reductase
MFSHRLFDSAGDFGSTNGMLTPLYDASYADYGLLLVILVASSYVYNRGSVLPKSDPFRSLFFESPQSKDGVAHSSSQTTRDIGEKARNVEARFTILWGSQSGTAESLAHRLGRDIQQRLKSTAIVGDLSDCDPATLAHVPNSAIVVLVMSTYGEGDPSDNAKEFVSHVTTQSDTNLSHVSFVAFGCGNSNYRYFNKVIEDAASGIVQCGGKLLLPVGAGDEATRSTQEDFLEWKEKLFSLLVSQHGLSDHKAEYQPTVEVTMSESPEATQDRDEIGISQKKEVYLPVISRQTVGVYNDLTRTCVDLKLDISGHPELKYRTGDHIAIWPRNSADEVDRLLQVLGQEHQRSRRLLIRPTDELTGFKVPQSTTLETLFSQHLDICAPVPRETVLALARITPSLNIKQELERIGGSRESYADFLDSNYLTIARLMKLMAAFDANYSWRLLPLSFLIDSIPALQPRLYSISSSSIVEPRRVGIVVSVKPGIVHKRPDTWIHGVASTYLSTTQFPQPDTETDTGLVRAEIRRASFKLPVNLKTPVVMVAAGTGIAPFRAFIQERARLSSIGRDVGPMMLFFGSQNESDCLYHDEFADIAAKQGPAFSLQIITAFSRPQNHGTEAPMQQKMYVQDRIFEHRRVMIRSLLEGDAAFYICGSSTMAKAVGDVIVKAAMEMKDWSTDAASQWRLERKKSSRWHEDVWG